MINILFVCTGNVFRSVVAEYSLKKYLKEHEIKGLTVNSAGMYASKQKRSQTFRNSLKFHHLNVSRHKPRKLTKKIVDHNDIIIVMAKKHKKFIKENFNLKKVYLYNELVKNNKADIYDAHEAFPNKTIKNLSEKQKHHIEETVKYLYKSTPKLYKEIRKIMHQRN